MGSQKSSDGWKANPLPFFRGASPSQFLPRELAWPAQLAARCNLLVQIASRAACRIARPVYVSLEPSYRHPTPLRPSCLIGTLFESAVCGAGGGRTIGSASGAGTGAIGWVTTSVRVRTTRNLRPKARTRRLGWHPPTLKSDHPVPGGSLLWASFHLRDGGWIFRSKKSLWGRGVDFWKEKAAVGRAWAGKPRQSARHFASARQTKTRLF